MDSRATHACAFDGKEQDGAKVKNFHLFLKIIFLVNRLPRQFQIFLTISSYYYPSFPKFSLYRDSILGESELKRRLVFSQIRFQ